MAEIEEVVINTILSSDQVSTEADQKTDNTVEEQYVVVVDPNDGEPVEIPAVEDGTLSLVTLEHAFPNAYGLKYKNPATGAKRVVSLDESGKYFLAPPGGWIGKIFEIVFRPVTAASTNSNKTKDLVVGGESVEKSAKRKYGSDGDDRTKEIVPEEEDTGVVGEKELSDELGAGKRARRMVDAGKTCSDLIVLGIPYDLEDDALKEYFEQFGAVEFHEIKRKKDGHSRGFGFVRMENYEDQVKILSAHYHPIGGRECQVRISTTEKTVDHFSDKTLTTNPRIFIGGLSDDIGRERVREFFFEHIRRFDKSATVVDLYYPRPFRSFAFMTVSSPQAAKELVRQRDFVIDGCNCEVTVAAPRREDDSNSNFQQPSPHVSMQRQPPYNSNGYGPAPMSQEMLSQSDPRYGYCDDYGYGRGPTFEQSYAPPPKSYQSPGYEQRMAHNQQNFTGNDCWARSGPFSSAGGRGANQSEAMMNYLPNDAVGAALRMLLTTVRNPQTGQNQDIDMGGRNGGSPRFD